VKTYVGAVEALREKERERGSKEDEAQFSTRNGAFLSFTPPSKTNVLFLQVFLLNLTRFWTKLRVLVPCFPDFIENSNVRGRIKS
jgi:hypothetical protein